LVPGVALAFGCPAEGGVVEVGRVAVEAWLGESAGAEVVTGGTSFEGLDTGWVDGLVGVVVVVVVVVLVPWAGGFRIVAAAATLWACSAAGKGA